MLSSTARILILGDWINYFSYAVFDGENLFLEEFIEGETKLVNHLPRLSTNRLFL